MFSKLLIAACLATVTLFSSSVLASPVDTYVFKDKVTEIRFNALNKELRCPKCQNQNLADSNSPIAADLRREVYDMLQQGKADMEIVDFMVSRYGEFVLYRPRVSSLTYLLWYGPAGLLFIGVIVVVIILRRKPVKNAQKPLSNDQKNKLDQILKHK
ncbi:cytochrome c-type biogenesis protein CcmH [Colwellia hornerae]|uniref:Cytochrome c-type biogenesis protein n=2 Tax=Colwellia hornerae TaxID=89402 RepID=A0A5C6QEK1_9GAMM|nr:cytochrome c-type biogenesis protein [Colwellia hornerae]TWX59583.1 cytochrome c-type biogenesis protein CcmH [Colwellia hornerae]TWX62953.1 cytochrome c-type biogenesis protein CcmH [Colwellia hornerae]TWX67123.1 cytochrome c-type biogenesis protein CcmH [Colwellia hornerae]